MTRVFYGVLRFVWEFVREMDRGFAMMRGEVEPGAYDRRRDLRCESRVVRNHRRDALVRRKKERFGA